MESRCVFIQAKINEIQILREKEIDKYSDKGSIRIRSRKKLKPNEKETQYPEVDRVEVNLFLQDLNEEEIIVFSYPIWNKFNIEYQLCELIQESDVDNLNEKFKQSIGKKFHFSIYLKRIDDVTFVRSVNAIWKSEELQETQESQEI